MTDFAATRARFHLPKGITYLDGNSLGPLPRAARARLEARLQDEWGEMLITAWNRAGWMDEPLRLGDRIGRLIGAPEGSVVVGDTLSIKLYQALAAALALRPERKRVLSDTGNFPSDLYMARGLIHSLGRGHGLELVAPEEIESRIGPDLAVLMLTEVDYRTGRRHDMQRLTRLAHEAGALVVWDIAHSAGAFRVDVTEALADFAVGCTYKFLNGGPGAPAFIHVAPRHADLALPALSGWLGHDAPFDFELDYRPARGIERMRVGTPPVLQMAALAAALDIFDEVDMAEVERRVAALSERLIQGVAQVAPQLDLASPPAPEARGAQVSFRFEQGYAAMQALIDRGVIGDFRAPDIMRFGITPLYLGEEDIDRAIEAIGEVMSKRLYEEPRYQVRSAVT